MVQLHHGRCVPRCPRARTHTSNLHILFGYRLSDTASVKQELHRLFWTRLYDIQPEKYHKQNCSASEMVWSGLWAVFLQLPRWPKGTFPSYLSRDLSSAYAVTVWGSPENSAISFLKWWLGRAAFGKLLHSFILPEDLPRVLRIRLRSILYMFDRALGFLPACATASALQEKCLDQNTRCSLVWALLAGPACSSQCSSKI